MPDQADLAREAESVLRESWITGMINVEVTDQTGARRMLMVRFPRAKIAIGTGVVTVIAFGLPWLLVPFRNESGLPDWAMSLAVVLVEALLFGWYLVLLLITAVGGGFFGLTPTGVLIDTGLSSVHFPWTAISGTSEDALEGKSAHIPFCACPSLATTECPAGPGLPPCRPFSWAPRGANWRILAWWFQPVPIDRMVTIVAISPAIPKSVRGSATRTLTSGSRPARPRARMTFEDAKSFTSDPRRSGACRPVRRP